MTAALVDPSPTQIRRLTQWRISTFWVMMIGYIGYYLIRGNLAVALPLLNQRFGFTNTELGTILTFSELAYALGKFTTGPLADQIGGKRIFMIGMVGGIVFNFAFPAGSSLMFFTVVWCLVRFFLSMGWGGIIKIIGAWYEPERNGTIMGLLSVNFQFGAVLASLFGSLLIYLGSGWQGLFIWPALTVSVLAVGSWFAAKESPHDVVAHARFGKTAGHKKALLDFDSLAGQAKPSARTIIAQLLQVALFRQVLVFSFFCHILRSFFMFWIPKFMVDMGMGNANAALSSAIFPLVGCVGTVALGYYTDRFGHKGDRAAAMWKMLLALALCLAAIAILIGVGGGINSSILILIGLAGLFLYGPYSLAAGALSLDIAGSAGAGTATGLVDGIGYIGGAVAAWGAGFIADRWGWAEVFWSLAGFALVTVGWTFYMSWHTRKGAS